MIYCHAKVHMHGVYYRRCMYVVCASVHNSGAMLTGALAH